MDKCSYHLLLQSAETMKATVDALNPYLPKQEKDSETTLILGTVKVMFMMLVKI